MPKTRMPYGQLIVFLVAISILLVILLGRQERTSGGTMLAFVVEEDINGDIYAFDLDTSVLKQLTHSPMADKHPSWSPDGQYLAYTAENAGKGDIYVIDVNSEKTQQLTYDPGNDEAPSWSPDGEYVVFVSERTGNSEIYIMDNRGNNQRQLTADASKWNHNPKWSPDGKYIAYESDHLGTGNGEIKILEAECAISDNLNCIVSTTNHPVYDQAFDWSPNGQQIVFASERAGNFRFDIYLADALTLENAYPLTQSDLLEFSPAWSPNGSAIAFVAYDQNYQGQINIMNIDGSELQPLAKIGQSNTIPSWSPNGQYIAYVTDDEQLFLMNADGSFQRSLGVSDVNDFYLAWRP